MSYRENVQFLITGTISQVVSDLYRHLPILLKLSPKELYAKYPQVYKPQDTCMTESTWKWQSYYYSDDQLLLKTYFCE